MVEWAACFHGWGALIASNMRLPLGFAVDIMGTISPEIGGFPIERKQIVSHPWRANPHFSFLLQALVDLPVKNRHLLMKLLRLRGHQLVNLFL